MKKIFSLTTIILLGLLIVLLNACKSNEIKTTADEKLLLAKESIAYWVENNADEYPYYKLVEFGDVTPRYLRTDRTIQLNDLIAQEQAKAEVDQKKLDSLNNLLESNKGLLMGYTIIHKYQTTNLAGEVLNNELLFFLDSTFRVASILDPEAFDLSLDPKSLFEFEQETKDSLK